MSASARPNKKGGIADVTMTDGAYAPAGNHDVDGSSDGTSITVNRR